MTMNFFFNGQTFPVCVSWWSSLSLHEHLNNFEDDWDEFIGLKHLWHLECRIDHVGVTESEDPDIFRVLIAVVLSAMLNNRENMLQSISRWLKAREKSDGWEIRRIQEEKWDAESIYDQMVEGLFGMKGLAESDALAFWTTGTEEDLVRLKDRIRRAGLPMDDREYLEPPHLRARRSERDRRLSLIRKEVIKGVSQLRMTSRYQNDLEKGRWKAS